MRAMGSASESVVMKAVSRIAAFLSACVAVSAGCGSPAVDKQGTPVSAAATVLHFGAADPTDPGLAFFSDAVARQSGHRLRVHVDRETYFSETPGGELRLVPDLGNGRIDFAYIPSRDWAATGDPGFQAVQYPFEVTTTQASVALARSAAATGLLAGMKRYGVTGLGLIPREPRRLITKNPLLSAADLKGRRVRISDSRETAALISALGGDPVQGVTAGDARQALHGDALDGIETAPIYITQNAYNVDAPYLTSFALIPKFEIIAAKTSAWARLSASNRQAIHAASAETLSWATEQASRNESRELAELCRNGVVMVQPSSAALHEMASAATAAAQSDAPTRLVLTRLAAVVPGLGPQTSASAVPPACQVATTAEQARTIHTSSASAISAPQSAAHGPTIPPGTYRETVTKEQMAAAGLNGPDFATDVTYTWTLKPDGTFRETQQPDYPDQGPMSGRYVVAGDTVTMTYDSGPTGTLPREIVRWSFLRGTLRFTVVSVEDPGAAVLYAVPWRKIS